MPGVADVRPDAPRWPRDRWISPSALKSYRQCAFRVKLQHIDRIDPPRHYNLIFNKGRTTHLILQRIAHALARRQPVIDEAEMQRMAQRHLPRQVFPSEHEWAFHVGDVVRWARCGRAHLERRAEATFLIVERNLSRKWAIYPGRAPYTVMARPDVVLLHTDEDGELLIEIIDYKTGKVRPEPEPPVLMRFVFWDLLEKHVGRASDARVRFTYLWLDTAEHTRIDLTLEHCHDHWTAISQGLHDLASEAVWAPRPSILCRYCPYFENICPETIPLERD